MKTLLRRTLSLLLVLVMAASMLPVVYAQETTGVPEEPVVLTDEDYASADALFAQIDAMEEAPAKKNASETELADAAAALVMASDSYVEGSLERNGNYFTWFTTEGVRCAYSPYMREKYDNMKAPENPEPSGIYNEPKATRGGWPSGNQVYLIAPYYGIDDSFTDQYKNEAKSIASAIGDTDGYTLYSGTSATVDKVAEAMSNGAVVIFDSHGTTDYDGKYVCNDPDGYEVYDYVSQANYSFLCLTSKTGLTTEDYNDGATYFTDTDGNMCACVNGAAIANHMTKNSPSGLLWMAICLGMATDTFATALRAKGVEVVYGYSQSVTFAGDYCFEETFWDNMIAGKTVAQSVSAMKSRWGEWDWSEAIAASYGYSGSGYSLSEARKYRSAFPIVVSDEDTHPGKRTSDSNYGADSQQTVNSTYTLYSQYNVTATSNNTAYGTVSVNGSTITAKPATGYFAQSATVTSGSATVSQNGNTFSVSAQSDCTVQITFAPKTAVTVSFSGTNVASQNGYAGDSMDLPVAEAPEGFQFMGWMTSPLNADTTTKPSFLTGSFTPTGNATLYALYSYVDENTSSGTGDYVKVTETPSDWSGDYLIVYEAGSFVFNGSLTTLEAVSNGVSVTITDSTISASEGDPYKFTIAPMIGGYSILSASGSYIYGTSGSNKLNTSSSPQLNTISIDASGNADIVSNTSHLRYNNTSGQDRFRYYKSSSYSGQQAIALYVKDGAKGTTYYTTNPQKCEHTNTQNVAAVAATCTASGFTAGVYCNDCETYISGHEVVDALGHSWSGWTVTTEPGCETAGQQTHTCSACNATETQAVDATGHDYNSVVTAPTETEQGYTTHTCANCGNSYVDSYTPALGVSYTVSFSVPAGVASVGSMTGNTSGITLPTAGAPEGYTFEGWSAVTVQETTEMPTILTGNYVPTANTTLYAIYSRTEGGSGSGDYEKVTETPSDWSGEYLIVYEDAGYIFDGSLTTYDAVSNYKAVTIANSSISATEGDPYKFIVAPMDGGYSFQGTGSYYFGHTADANKITTSATAMLNTIALDAEGNANIICEGGAYLRFNTQSGQTRFRYYKSSSYLNQQAIALYVKSDGGTTYYTTVFESVEAAVCENGAQVNVYATVAEAVAACGENQYVQLLNDVEADLALTKDLYIDLNGHILVGDITGQYTVYGMDSATNEYKLSEGYIVGDISNVQIHVLTDEAMTGDIYRYMAIEDENGWSFNRYYVGITHTSLNTEKVGLGYKAAVFGNLRILLAVDSFSYTLQLGDNRAITRTKDGINDDGVVTLLVKNYMIEQFGETDLSAYVTVTLDGEAITSAVQTTSFRKTVELINDNYTSFSADQLSAVRELILANEVMQNWNVANLLKEETDVDPAMVAIVNTAYALASGESMTTTSTLTGVITKVDTAYSSGYGNISVTIAVAGAEDKPILCYRMKGEGADQITVGDTITVTGTLKNYNGTIEFDAGCSLDSWVHTGEDVDKLTDPVEIVNAAYALAVGASLPYEVTLTGTIISVDTEYSADYGNVTVTITVAGAEDKPIVCFRLKGTGADSIAVGDTITVTGTLMNYNGTVEFGSGCTLG